MQSEQTLTSKEQFANTVKQSIHEHVSKAKSNKEKGDLFLEWTITKLFDASPDEIRNQITDGPNDMGIDAWLQPDIETENGGIIQLFQCKYNESHDESEILQFKEDVKKFLKMKVEEIPRKELKELHQRIINQNLEPELYYITDQKIVINKRSRKLKIYGIDQIVDKLWDEITGIPSGVEETITLEDSLLYNDTVLGVLSLAELRKFIEKTHSYIFESNIRKYLQRTKINKALEKTLEQNANDVFYYNNGITIVVKNLDKNGNDIKLVEPQIVNGAQTSKTIFEKLPLLTNVQGSILVTIIKENNNTTRKDITQFRNSQNAVKGKDLISLQNYHTGIRGQLKNFGYYYEQQAGGWLYMKPEERNSYRGHDIYKNYLTENHENKIPASVAIQSMVAGIFQNPTKPYSSIAGFMPNGTHYPEIFDSKLKEDYRLLLYPYLIKCHGETLGYGDRDAKPEQKRYARLLFVTAYFKILFDYIIKKDANEIKKNPELMEKYFKNFEVNKKLLDLTDKAMEYYFHRARAWFDEHDEVVTWHNFFSHHAWNDTLQKDFKSFLKDNSEELQEIRENFRVH